MTGDKTTQQQAAAKREKSRPLNRWFLPKRGAVKGFIEINGQAVDPETEFCVDQTRDNRVYYRHTDNSLRRIKSYKRQEPDEVTSNASSQKRQEV